MRDRWGNNSPPGPLPGCPPLRLPGFKSSYRKISLSRMQIYYTAIDLTSAAGAVRYFYQSGCTIDDPAGRDISTTRWSQSLSFGSATFDYDRIQCRLIRQQRFRWSAHYSSLDKSLTVREQDSSFSRRGRAG